MTSLLESEVVFEYCRGGFKRFRHALIRPMEERDLDSMPGLCEKAGVAPLPAPTARRMFFELPWQDDALSSLVYESAGEIIAFLGIMPRPMSYRGRSIRAAVAHHLIAEQSRRGMRAAVELARRFISGPQDLAVASGNDFSRRIWRFVGGSVSPLHSFSWTRTLRPAQYALSFLKSSRMTAPAAVTLQPACRAIDATLDLFGHTLTAEAALSDELDAVTMSACISSLAGDRALQPVYDLSSLEWLIETLTASRHHGNLHKVAVRTPSGRVLGWYLYYLRPSGIAEVLQLGGTAETVREILNHLFAHARQRGALAVTGQIDARLCGAVSESRCVFHRPDHGWILFHSRDQKIADAVHGGDAFLSRLEADWWTLS